MKDTIISVTNLSKHYNGIRAVDGLSFSVQKGEVYGFLGQNGAGKSTTIRMLLTLVRPTDGEIEIFGMNLRHHRREILGQVGAIIERPDLYKYLTAAENLRVMAAMNGLHLTRSAIRERLDHVGLADRANSAVRTYSQGMKQRLGIAAALIHDPQLVMLDEPTNGLDPQGIAAMRSLITGLSREQGKTVLVSSHLLHEIELIADSMLIIDKGKKVVEGTVKELLRPEMVSVLVETEAIVDTGSLLAGTLWMGRLEEAKDHQLRFALHNTQIPGLVRFLVEHGVSVRSVEPVRSLESYFLSLTKPA